MPCICPKSRRRTTADCLRPAESLMSGPRRTRTWRSPWEDGQSRWPGPSGQHAAGAPFVLSVAVGQPDGSEHSICLWRATGPGCPCSRTCARAHRRWCRASHRRGSAHSLTTAGRVFRRRRLPRIVRLGTLQVERAGFCCSSRALVRHDETKGERCGSALRLTVVEEASMCLGAQCFSTKRTV